MSIVQLSPFIQQNWSTQAGTQRPLSDLKFQTSKPHLIRMKYMTALIPENSYSHGNIMFHNL